MAQFSRQEGRFLQMAVARETGAGDAGDVGDGHADGTSGDGADDAGDGFEVRAGALAAARLPHELGLNPVLGANGFDGYSDQGRRSARLEPDYQPAWSEAIFL